MYITFSSRASKLRNYSLSINVQRRSSASILKKTIMFSSSGRVCSSVIFYDRLITNRKNRLLYILV